MNLACLPTVWRVLVSSGGMMAPRAWESVLPQETQANDSGVRCHNLYFLVITARTCVQLHMSAYTKKKQTWQL